MIKCCLKCCICCLWCLEKLLKFLNQNAYTIIGQSLSSVLCRLTFDLRRIFQQIMKQCSLVSFLTIPSESWISSRSLFPIFFHPTLPTESQHSCFLALLITQVLQAVCTIFFRIFLYPYCACCYFWISANQLICFDFLIMHQSFHLVKWIVMW